MYCSHEHILKRSGTDWSVKDKSIAEGGRVAVLKGELVQPKFDAFSAETKRVCDLASRVTAQT